MNQSSSPALEMRGISKEFPGVKALERVSFSVGEGEIHSLCGENGAGKSTLMKILAGFYPYPSYEGEVFVGGKLSRFHHIRESEHAGIAIIYQELSLIPEMTIGENIFLGREPATLGVINWHDVYSRTHELLSSIGLTINPRERVKNLGIGQQQLVEIAKALSQNPKILVLDEPTSALTESEIKILLDLLLRLKNRGVSCIMISHKLNEVLEISDRVTVLRDGKSIASYPIAEATESRIISDMVGRELKDLFPRVAKTLGAPVFEVRGISVNKPGQPGRMLLNNISFQVRRGEVLGIAGLMGSGRSELLMRIFGSLKGTGSGEIFLGGKKLKINSPHDAIENGLALLTEDRKRYGLLLQESVLKNLSLSSLMRMARSGIINRNREAVVGTKYAKELKVKTANLETAVKNLSGGNQQKVVLAKCLMTEPKVLFLDEPTRGIDVGAKAEIYGLINTLAAQGMAIVMVSSELPEVLGMSDRVVVMSEGKITGEFTAEEATQEKLMTAATVRAAQAEVTA
jgi:D-xylose transport system ATP-binding protein